MVTKQTSHRIEALDDGLVNVETTSPPGRSGRRCRSRYFLVADDSGGDRCDVVAAAYAQPRQRRHNVQCRWMFLLPRGAEPARSPEARRWACDDGAVRDDLPRSQHLAGS